MSTRQVSGVAVATVTDGGATQRACEAPDAPRVLSPLAVRVHGEYSEMPGLRLTVRQAARLFGVTFDVADAVLAELWQAAVLARSDDDVYFMNR